ncbi:hypothetical protein GJAV_G00169880 [Gymnothorax javanicus]|nr:hypothetical protein GJAV_G00169880 [Gymnothorax javanicus]
MNAERRQPIDSEKRSLFTAGIQQGLKKKKVLPKLTHWQKLGVDLSGAVMKVIWAVPLLLMGILGCVCGSEEEGCARWKPSPDKEVCCTECKPGNRLVDDCGRDPSKLCELCKDGTYVSPGQGICRPCTQCRGDQKLKQACTSSSDAVCECKTGYHCGDPKCSFCYQECGKGQQPVDNRTCQVCPSGTFNNNTHSKCVPWSTRCPHPDQEIVQQGTAVSDIVCKYAPDGRKDYTEWMMMAILAMTLVFIIVLITATAYLLVRRRKKKKKKMTATEETEAEKPIAGEIEVAEVRHLVGLESCCLPQQEQGSSLESIASLDSKIKLVSV